MMSFNVSGDASPPCCRASVCHAIVVSEPSGAPVQIRSRCASASAASRVEAHLANAELVAQPAGEIRDPLQERVAVDPEPDGLVDALELGRQPGARLDAPACCGDQVCAAHVLERPFAAQRVGELGYGLVEAPGEPGSFVADDGDEAGLFFLVHLGERRDGLDRRADAAQRRARALRQGLQQQIAPLAGLDATRDVVQHQDESGDRVVAIVRVVARHPADRGHLHPHELTRRRRGDEIRHR